MRRKEIDGIKIVRTALRGQRKLKRAQRTEASGGKTSQLNLPQEGGVASSRLFGLRQNTFHLFAPKGTHGMGLDVAESGTEFAATYSRKLSGSLKALTLIHQTQAIDRQISAPMGRHQRG
jgi:hypothetical protein